MFFFDFYKNKISNLLKCPKEKLVFWWDFYFNNIIPKDYIVYQTENLNIDHKRDQNYFKFLDQASIVYDYSVQNLKYYSKSVFKPYLPNLNSVSNKKNKDIDVLFYGGMSEKRKELIDKLKYKYTNVIAIERFDSLKSQIEYMKKSRFILSTGFYDNKYNDFLRITPALNLGCNILLDKNEEIWSVDFLLKYFPNRIEILK